MVRRELEDIVGEESVFKGWWGEEMLERSEVIMNGWRG